VSGRETQASSKNGILCHFYPIATHSSDISDAVIDAFGSLAKALTENNDIMLIRYGLAMSYCKRILELLPLVLFFYDLNL
jgi:hypothetical protein